MSRRTAEASKAIRDAWDNERELVSIGKGTRDWSEEQQREILEGRCARDENGKAFEGHHMMNAEAHPELQGDSGNIQFLTRSEHLSAHGGSWRNPTSGYYDPATGVTRHFENDAYSPCVVIDLSSPVVVIDKTREMPNGVDEGIGIANDVVRRDEPHGSEPRMAQRKTRPRTVKAVKLNFVRQIGSAVGSAVSSAVGFVKNHPEIIAIATATAAGVVRQVTSNLIDETIDDCQSGGGMGSSVDEEDATLFCDETVSSPFETDEAYGIECDDYPVERASPRRHDVSGYERIVNGRTVHVSGYVRGRNMEDDAR